MLEKKFNKGDKIGKFTSSDELGSLLIRHPKYNEFREVIESAPHDLVHKGIEDKGGDMSTNHSTDDPIVYLHHACVFNLVRVAEKVSSGCQYL